MSRDDILKEMGRLLVDIQDPSSCVRDAWSRWGQLGTELQKRNHWWPVDCTCEDCCSRYLHPT